MASLAVRSPVAAFLDIGVTCRARYTYYPEAIASPSLVNGLRVEIFSLRRKYYPSIDKQRGGCDTPLNRFYRGGYYVSVSLSESGTRWLAKNRNLFFVFILPLRGDKK